MSVASAQSENYREVIPEYFICLPPQFPRPLQLLGLGDVEVHASLKGALKKKKKNDASVSLQKKGPLWMHIRRLKIATKNPFLFLTWFCRTVLFCMIFFGGEEYFSDEVLEAITILGKLLLTVKY